jgi:outer membrane murein-binding lipoprotein Lpp
MLVFIQMRSHRLQHRRMREDFIAFLGLIGVLMIFLAGCATTSQMAEDASLTRSVVAVVNQLQAAYEARDAQRLAALFTGAESGIHQDSASTAPPLSTPLSVNDASWLASVSDEFSRSSRIQIQATIMKIVLEGDRITVSLYWDGTWKLKEQPLPSHRHGDAVLLLSKTYPPRILSATGQLPWTALATP